jgi:hypothetical protein
VLAMPSTTNHRQAIRAEWLASNIHGMTGTTLSFHEWKSVRAGATPKAKAAGPVLPVVVCFVVYVCLEKDTCCVLQKTHVLS